MTRYSQIGAAPVGTDPLRDSQAAIRQVIQEGAAGWNADEPWLAWAGECGEFAHVVWETMRSRHGTEVEALNSTDDLKTAAPPPGTTWDELEKLGVIADMWHVWVALDGRHYDAAHPEGVEQPLELRAIRQGIVESMGALAALRLCRLMQAQPWWVESMRLSQELGQWMGGGGEAIGNKAGQIVHHARQSQSSGAARRCERGRDCAGAVDAGGQAGQCLRGDPQRRDHDGRTREQAASGGKGILGGRAPGH